MEATQLLRGMQQGLDQQQQLEAFRQQQTLMQQQQAQAQMQQQQHTQQPQGAPFTATTGIDNQLQHQQLNTRGFDSWETCAGGEDQWQYWSWKIKTAVSGMNGELKNTGRS